ncbi:hypothetical protein AAFC00_005554 [Neodothiora populina]|uniref:Uncharacterized protein n=1 Tax=Neodothiora populina TaxID=2781224 RepID=A0ABR3PL95_9PEZI
MLGLGKDQDKRPKCFFAHTVLPQYIDDKQPPTKKRPFSTVYAQAFNHTLDLIVPASVAPQIQHALETSVGEPQYCKVHLKLADILTGDFFNYYMKSGNIALRSEGREGLDTTFSLSDGVLRIELDRATYERAGLQGQPIQDFGRRHIKSRFAVTLNLRLPSMVKGKKGFDRVLWAAQNVFTDALTWLFYDLRSPSQQDSGPIKDFQPFHRTVTPEVVTMDSVRVPAFPDRIEEGGDVGAVEVTELLEWLTLVCLDSPRVKDNDDIDSYLSRYEVPRFGAGEKQPEAMDLLKLRWHGFMPSIWVAKAFAAALKGSGDEWFAMQVCGFEDKSHMILKRDGKTMSWDCC